MRTGGLAQVLTRIELHTERGRGLYEITRTVRSIITEQGLRSGSITLHIRHTSASLLIQENADPEVQVDLERFLSRICPDGMSLFDHVAEGPDDMPAHVRSALTTCNTTLPVIDGAPDLGSWQGIYLWEHRIRPHRRGISIHLLGDFAS